MITVVYAKNLILWYNIQWLGEYMYKLFIKRLIDIVLSLMGIIVLTPVMMIVALLIKIKLGGPVVFTQQRPGKNGKIFKMYKFRTMTNAKDANGKLLPDEVRLTPFGKKLRSTSLDELPSLINILKGEMSIVGPRPLLVDYLPLYNKEQARRHEMRPGLTGLAQVNGRNLLSWNERFKLDVYYIDNCSFILDVKIFLKTFYKVFKKEGITQSETTVMEDFTGDN